MMASEERHDAALYLFCALMIAAMLWAFTGCSAPAAYANDRVPEAPGQPLDATRHPAPAFADGSWSYRVVNRTTGAVCWLVWMEKAEGQGQWVAIPDARQEME